MKDILLTIIRNKETCEAEYRSAADKLGLILAIEVGAYLPKSTMDVTTPLTVAVGYQYANPIMLVPILRSGIALLHPFLQFYPAAKVGFIGMKRDEKTAIAHQYYANLPAIQKGMKVIILEPMIATGGSVIASLKLLIDLKIDPSQIIVASILGAREGVDRIKNEIPDVNLHILHIDDELNHQKFILPGLGDFGDRYFGTDY